MCPVPASSKGILICCSDFFHSTMSHFLGCSCPFALLFPWDGWSGALTAERPSVCSWVTSCSLPPCTPKWDCFFPLADLLQDEGMWIGWHCGFLDGNLSWQEKLVVLPRAGCACCSSARAWGLLCWLSCFTVSNSTTDYQDLKNMLLMFSIHIFTKA